MSAVDWVLASLAIFAGACAQGSMGFGLGMIAAPFLAMIEPSLIPAPVLIVAMGLAALVAWRERASLDARGLKWAIAGRVPGSALGTYAVVVLPEQTLLVVFAVLILAGVGLSVAGWRVEPTPTTQAGAGALSGFMGSITSVGGPPMALLYQRRSGAELRATLSLFFLFGTTLSVTLLAVAGKLHGRDVGRAGILLGPMVAGFLVARWLAPRLDAGLLRPVLLWVSGAAATVVLLSALW
jgi:uncharacterized membrane protein YfcA